MFQEQIEDLQYNLLYGENEKDRRFDVLQIQYDGLQRLYNEVSFLRPCDSL